MLTTAITGAIAGVLALFGINPLKWIPVIWIAIKVILVAVIFLVSSRFVPRNKPNDAAEPVIDAGTQP